MESRALLLKVLTGRRAVFVFDDEMKGNGIENL